MSFTFIKSYNKCITFFNSNKMNSSTGLEKFLLKYYQSPIGPNIGS